MIYLLLAICSSAAIAVIMRISADKVKANISMLAANYVVCAFLGAAYAGFAIVPIRAEGFPVAVGLGIIGGFLYMGGFSLLQKNTAKNGIVLSQIFMKLGLLVPITVSVLFFKEMATGLQVVGFCIAVIAIILINIKKGVKKAGFSAGLILLLLAGGGGDAMAKFFEVLGNPELDDQFLAYIFFTAFVLCLLLALGKKERPGRMDLLFGAIIGVPNFFSSKFLLGALMQLPGVVVYPTFSVGTILVVTLIGVFIFRERLVKLQWIALIGILIALVMLNI